MKRITIKACPDKKSIHEQHERYAVMLDGQPFSELYFNLTGYVGTLPTPEGSKLTIGEKPLSTYRREIEQLNREFGQKVG